MPSFRRHHRDQAVPARKGSPDVIEREMAKRKEKFFALVRGLTPFEADEKAALLELALARMVAYMPEDVRLSIIPQEFHATRSLEPDSPASMMCAAFGEAHFSIMGNYIEGLPHHLRAAKCDCEGVYAGSGKKVRHRFNVSAYTGKVFDPTLDQFRVAREIPAYDNNRRHVAYGRNGVPKDDTRIVIRYLSDLLRDPARSRECFGALYEGYRAALYPLAKAAADYWPTKPERDMMSLDPYGRTARQAVAHYQDNAPKREALQARMRAVSATTILYR